MSDSPRHVTDLPLQQQSVRARCFHSTGVFTEFKQEEIDQSIPQRFEHQGSQLGPLTTSGPAGGSPLVFRRLVPHPSHVAKSCVEGHERGFLMQRVILYEVAEEMLPLRKVRRLACVGKSPDHGLAGQ